MKTFKRIAALALSAVMAVGLLATPAMAAEGDETPPNQPQLGNLELHPGDNTITINKATPEMSYFIFKLFDVDTDADGKLYYTITDSASDWGVNPIWGLVDGEDTAGAGLVEVGTDDLDDSEETITAQVKWTQGDETAAPSFGKNMLRACVKLVTDAALLNTLEDLNNNKYFVYGYRVANRSGTVTFENLPDGYYVVGTRVGALVTVMDGQRQEIEDKYVGPEMTKEVWENSIEEIDGTPNEEQIKNGPGWQKTNDASVGDTVWYRTTIDLSYADTMLEELVNMKRMTVTMESAAALKYCMHYYDRVDTGLQWTGKDNWESGNGIQAYLRDKETGDLIHLQLTSEDAPDGPWIHYTVNIPEEYGISDSMLEELINLNRGSDASQIGLGEFIYAVHPYTFHCQLTGIPKAEYEIVYVYSAKVTDNAVVGQKGNTNAGAVGSARSSTTTYVHDFDLVKINSGKEVLDGATFMLLDEYKDEIPLVYCNEMRTEADEPWGGLVFRETMYPTNGNGSGSRAAGSNETKWYPNEGNGDNPYFPYIEGGELAEGYTGYYRPATEEERNAEGFESAVITAGHVRIQGLDSGTYYLKETAAPDNYNMIDTPQKVIIAAEKRTGSKRELTGRATLIVDETEGAVNATVTETTIEVEGEEKTISTYVSGGLPIVNLTGAELPSTGGIGTTIFYVVGALLVVGAGVLLVVKKRMSNGSDDK